jgi:hypothetical protein
MKTTWLARRLGLDGNPLRRRSDRIAIHLGILLLAVFLVGAPQLSVTAIAWAGHAGAAGPQAEHDGHRNSAIRTPAGSAPTMVVGEAFGYSRSLAGQTAPDLQPRTGHLAVVAREATAAVVATATLGIMLLCLAWAGRRVLDRRRLAAWEEAWAVVGPQWTRRFRQQRGPP